MYKLGHSALDPKPQVFGVFHYAFEFGLITLLEKRHIFKVSFDGLNTHLDSMISGECSRNIKITFSDALKSKDKSKDNGSEHSFKVNTV